MGLFVSVLTLWFVSFKFCICCRRVEHCLTFPLRHLSLGTEAGNCVFLKCQAVVVGALGLVGHRKPAEGEALSAGLVRGKRALVLHNCATTAERAWLVTPPGTGLLPRNHVFFLVVLYYTVALLNAFSSPLCGRGYFRLVNILLSARKHCSRNKKLQLRKCFFPLSLSII